MALTRAARLWSRAVVGESYPRAALVAVSSAYGSVQLAMTPVSPLLPSLAKYYQVGVPLVTWVLTAYLLVMACTVFTAGRLGDMFGHRRIFFAGIGIFTLGALLSAVAPNLGLLIFVRSLQGLGSGLVLGNTLAIVADAFPESQRGRYIGIAVLGSGAGSFLGIIVAGAFAQFLEWRWFFSFMVLPGLVSTALAWRLQKRPEGHLRRRGQRLDLAGAVLLFGTLAVLVLAPLHLHGGEPTFRSGWFFHSSMVAAFLVLGGLLLVESCRANPLLQLAHFRHIPFSFSLAANTVLHWNMATIMMVPFLVEKGLLLTSWHTTLLLVTNLGLGVMLSPLAGLVYDRTRSRVIRPAAQLTTAIALLLIALLGAHISYWGIFGLVALGGLGAGFFLTPNNTVIMSSLPAQWRGFATGSLETTRQIGHTLGVAMAGVIFDLTMPAAGLATPQHYVQGYLNTALAMGLITISGACFSGIASWVAGSPRPPQSGGTLRPISDAAAGSGSVYR